MSNADLDIGVGGSTDPFASSLKGHTKIHVRTQQRNGRKCITTIQGLDVRAARRDGARARARARALTRAASPPNPSARRRRTSTSTAS